jgi:hypothetical protein
MELKLMLVEVECSWRYIFKYQVLYFAELVFKNFQIKLIDPQENKSQTSLSITNIKPQVLVLWK